MLKEITKFKSSKASKSSHLDIAADKKDGKTYLKAIEIVEKHETKRNLHSNIVNIIGVVIVLIIKFI